MNLRRSRALVGNLHHPFWVKSQWRNAGHPQVTSKASTDFYSTAVCTDPESGKKSQQTMYSDWKRIEAGAGLMLTVASFRLPISANTQPSLYKTCSTCARSVAQPPTLTASLHYSP